MGRPECKGEGCSEHPADFQLQRYCSGSGHDRKHRFAAPHCMRTADHFDIRAESPTSSGPKSSLPTARPLTSTKPLLGYERILDVRNYWARAKKSMRSANRHGVNGHEQGQSRRPFKLTNMAWNISECTSMYGSTALPALWITDVFRSRDH